MAIRFFILIILFLTNLISLFHLFGIGFVLKHEAVLAGNFLLSGNIYVSFGQRDI